MLQGWINLVASESSPFCALASSSRCLPRLWPMAFLNTAIYKREESFYEHSLSRFYLFLEKGEGKEKERESNSNVWLPLVCPVLGTQPATQACAPDWESNHRPLGSQSGAQSTEPHQPGLFFILFCILYN